MVPLPVSLYVTYVTQVDDLTSCCVLLGHMMALLV